MITGGDFNTDLMEETPKSISLLDLMREYNLMNMLKNRLVSLAILVWTLSSQTVIKTK